MAVVERAPREYRRRLHKLVRKPPVPELGRRVLAILRLMDGYGISDVARMLEAGRSSVNRSARRYNHSGVAGLLGARRGRDHQTAVVTPGQNQQHYIAGALHARSGRRVWVEHFHKTTELFIKLLDAVRRAYRRARRIVLVLDNYIIHKTDAVQRWLEDNPKCDSSSRQPAQLALECLARR